MGIMNELPYLRIPEHSAEMSATSVLIRLLDGIGFRYRWATEGLNEEDILFRPCKTSMNMWEVLEHIHELTDFIEAYINGKSVLKGDNPPKNAYTPSSLGEIQRLTLEAILRTRNSLTRHDDRYLARRKYPVPGEIGKFPIWNLINGPLCDTLTHIGQIASWRRINNNPVPGADAFHGEPPRNDARAL